MPHTTAATKPSARTPARERLQDLDALAEAAGTSSQPSRLPISRGDAFVVGPERRRRAPTAG